MPIDHINIIIQQLIQTRLNSAEIFYYKTLAGIYYTAQECTCLAGYNSLRQEQKRKVVGLCKVFGGEIFVMLLSNSTKQ